MLADALGRPLRFVVTGGQVTDCTQADRLLENVKTEYVIADKGYDSEGLLRKIEELGAVAVVPPRSNRKVQREYDRDLYKRRNLIERTFNKLKRFGRLGTR
jgi:transposase